MKPGPVRTVLYLDHAPFLGGAQVALLDILAHLDRSRYRALVACPPASPLMERLKGIGVEAVPLRLGKLNRPHPAGLYSLFEARGQLARILAEHDLDILHTNTVRAHIVASFVPRPKAALLFWTLNDFTFPRWLYRLLAPRADRVLAVSEAVRDFYAGSRRGRRMPLVLYNGVELPCLPLKGGLRAELGLPPDAPVVGCIGRLVRGKGQDVFLRAMALVAREHPGAYFLVVGEPDPGEGRGPGSYSHSLEVLARELGLGGWAIFTGFRADMGRLYATLDLVVHCPREAEGLGLVVAEAMGRGLPVVAVGLGGLRELIEDGVSGILAGPEDPEGLARAVLVLLRDRERAARLSQAARRRAEERFDLGVQVRKLEEFYERALAER